MSDRCMEFREMSPGGREMATSGGEREECRCPDILSYPSDFPTSAYCASAHQYCILFLTLNNNI